MFCWLYEPVVFLRAVSITEVTEVVVPAEVLQQLIVVKVAVVTELAERVSAVTGVVRVALCAVTCQVLPVVPLAFVTENLKEEGHV